MKVYNRWHGRAEKAEPPGVAKVPGTVLYLAPDAAERYNQVKAAKLAAIPTYNAGANAYATTRASTAIFRTTLSGGYRRGRSGAVNY